MITTINRMNLDPQFSDAFPTTETQDENGFTFILAAKYRPDADTGAVQQTAGPVGGQR
jgi:hypothetical protein